MRTSPQDRAEYPSTPFLHGRYVGDGSNDVLTDNGQPIGWAVRIAVRWDETYRRHSTWKAWARYAGIEMNATGPSLVDVLRGLETDYFAQTHKP